MIWFDQMDCYQGTEIKLLLSNWFDIRFECALIAQVLLIFDAWRGLVPSLTRCGAAILGCDFCNHFLATYNRTLEVAITLLMSCHWMYRLSWPNNSTIYIFLMPYLLFFQKLRCSNNMITVEYNVQAKVCGGACLGGIVGSCSNVLVTSLANQIIN